LQFLNFLQVLSNAEDLEGVKARNNNNLCKINNKIFNINYKPCKNKANIDFYALFVTNATNRQLTITKPTRKEKRKKSTKSKKRTNQ